MLGRAGTATPITAEAIGAWVPDDGFLWVHVDLRHPDAAQWLRTHGNLSAGETEILDDADARPRAVVMQDHVLAIFRDIHATARSAPGELSGARVRIHAHGALTMRRRKSTAFSQLYALALRGDAPPDAGEFLATLVDLVLDGIDDELDVMDENLAKLEAIVDERERARPDRIRALRRDLSALRRTTIRLHRWLIPQRDTIAELAVARVTWLDDLDRGRLRTLAERARRCVDELDALRNRCQLVSDELANQLSEISNRTIYVLTLFTALFLPITFITGLLGINVGGIPGADNPHAFWEIAGLLAMVFVGEVALYRAIRWWR